MTDRDRFTWREGDLEIVEATVEGEPALFLTPREKAWRAKVHATGLTVGAHLSLHFRVASFRRAGNLFDIDNLAKPVLDELGARPETIWVKVVESTAPGVTMSRQISSAVPRTAVSVAVREPRARSIKPVVPIAELRDLSKLGDGNEPLALEIRFDDTDVPLWDFGFDGPVKPFIDSMGPLLGPAPQGPADHRIKDLRVSRGLRPGNHGAQIRIWLLD